MTSLASSDFLTLPRAGEIANGDAAVIRRDGAHALIAIVDALGHGEKAGAVAAVAVEVLQSCRIESGPLAIIGAIDGALRGGRGACALVVVVGPERLEGCSVGNVELRSNLNLPFVLTPGVLGARVRSPRVFSVVPSKNARLVAYSDGIGSKFQLDEFAEFSTKDACRAIFDRQRRSHDDATLLVADLIL